VLLDLGVARESYDSCWCNGFVPNMKSAGVIVFQDCFLNAKCDWQEGPINLINAAKNAGVKRFLMVPKTTCLFLFFWSSESS